MTDNRATELLPCPFCGGEAESFNPFGTMGGTWTVLCSECASSVGFEQTEAEAIAAWNTRAQTVFGMTFDEVRQMMKRDAERERTSGTLTAEQVREATYTHSIHADCADADWQAIADELNAALGGGECEFVIEDNMNESEGMGDVWFRCTNCNTMYDYYADDWLMKQNYCPHCGRKIRKAVKR